ncbi:MAG: tetratricopeptide repeat protein [Clostridium sp.]|nr:tetratricopeptide repeat protein [Clostridium sp.]
MSDFDGSNGKRERNRRKIEEERARRRAKRRRKVMIQKIIIAAVLVLLIGGISGGIILSQASFRLSRKLSAGDKYTEKGDYEMAQSAYEEALQIDPTTVKAYQCLAQNNLERNDGNAAKEILYTGWETTKDENLLQSYCTIILNEAVTQINEGNCGLDTVDMCLQVLRDQPESGRAYEVLDACYEKLIAKEENISQIFMDANPQADTCLYTEYEQRVRSLLALYEQFHTDALQKVLIKYAMPDVEYLYISMPHLTSYHTLIEDVAAASSDAAAMDLASCLACAKERAGDFADMFTAFEQGNFENAREFIVSDMYQQIQDAFIAGESGYWEGAALIPVNEEQMALHKTENGYTFFWLDYEDYEDSQGVITVWGSRHLDDGVQRTTISYEPAGEGGAYYPHTEYIITYEYSNVLKNKTLVQMNYRFTTQISTQDGMTKTAIGDWGGEHEWEIDYST